MNDSIRSQLDQDGYVLLEDFLRPAECDELRAAAVELAKKAAEEEEKFTFGTRGDSSHTKTSYFMESNDKIRYFYEVDAIGSDGKLQVEPAVALNKIGHALHLLHPIFRCYTYSDRVKSVCQMLGFKEPAVVQSMVIYKNPRIGSAVSAHQDATYLYTEPVPPVGFWIALEDATVRNGCLWMIRGSQKTGVHRRQLRNPDKDPFLIFDKPVAVYPESSFTPVPAKKGDCILIHGNVVHKSAQNKSDESRHGYTFHVIEKQNNHYSEDNWLQEGPNAPFLNLYTTPQMV